MTISDAFPDNFTTGGSTFCSGGNFCIGNTVTAVCKFYDVLYKSVQTLPDFLNCLLAVDRFIAVKSSTWYKDHCTRKAAWVVIIPVMMIRLPDSVIRLLKVEVIPGQRGCFLLGEVKFSIFNYISKNSHVARGIVSCTSCQLFY